MRQLCGQVNDSHIGQTVSLSGWVLNRRDHGGVIFIDLRDRSGHVQVVADPDKPETFAVADSTRNEFVLSVTGRVKQRPEGTTNENLSTGAVEVIADEIQLLAKSDALPFQVDENNIGEETRLKYRFLDLRRPSMQSNLRMRHEVIRYLRNYLDNMDFMDIETPILTRSTPEGARDYLVPSRTHPGEFFALPQSPQLFKQLLMISGYERYYQVARCFRDEDLRADRQPEFSQLDIEMSFVDESTLMDMVEQMICACFKTVLDVNLIQPFPRLSYAECMLRYGTDRPDLRNPLLLTDVTDLMKTVGFKVFSGPANDPQSRVAALCVPKGNDLTRAQIDNYTDYVGRFGAKGLAYIKVNQVEQGREGLQSPILKFLSDEIINEIIVRTEAQTGDLIFFGASRQEVVNEALSNLRDRLAEDLALFEGTWAPLWVVDFPLVAWDAQENRWQALHHPFTSPKSEQVDMLDSDPGRVLSKAYDMVLNGSEIGGGSIRIHDSQLQQKMLQVLGINNEQARLKFGFLLDALRYGAPPHGGIAFGIDRLVAMICCVDSIRDVIAFPKTQKASCLLTRAPNKVDNRQLKELDLQIRKAPRS